MGTFVVMSDEEKGEEGKGRNAIAGFLNQWARSGLKPPLSSPKSK
jgi:hypothetical protein